MLIYKVQCISALILYPNPIKLGMPPTIIKKDKSKLNLCPLIAH